MRGGAARLGEGAVSGGGGFARDSGPEQVRGMAAARAWPGSAGPSAQSGARTFFLTNSAETKKKILENKIKFYKCQNKFSPPK